MSSMGDGYVGTAQDAVRSRRLKKQREAERRKIQELKTKSASSKAQPGLLQFGSSTSERVNIQSKIEEEEKEKLQKQLQEEEELQLPKRKKRKFKGNSRLSFAEDIDNDAQDDDIDNDAYLSLEEVTSQVASTPGSQPPYETADLSFKVRHHTPTLTQESSAPSRSNRYGASVETRAARDWVARVEEEATKAKEEAARANERAARAEELVARVNQRIDEMLARLNSNGEGASSVLAPPLPPSGHAL